MVRTRARHLLPLLLLMTVVTGLVDAVSYLALGRVFVANMTGNVVFLGFAWAGEASLSARESLLALLGFLLGPLSGGELAARQNGHRGRRLAAGSCMCAALLLTALVVAVVFRPSYTGGSRDAMVALLALAMGLQNATARTLDVPGISTTVLTMTLTALAADTRPAGRTNPLAVRQTASVLAMLAGALVGALLVLHTDPVWAMAAAAVLMLLIAVTAVALVRGTTGMDWKALT